MNDQTPEIVSIILDAIENHFQGADSQEAKKTCLIAAAELVGHAAQAISERSPGMPVVELILLSERIATLAEQQSSDKV